MSFVLDDVYECRNILQRMAYTGGAETVGDMAAAVGYYARTYALTEEERRLLQPLIDVYGHVAGGLRRTLQELRHWFAPLTEGVEESAADILLTAPRLQGAGPGASQGREDAILACLDGLSTENGQTPCQSREEYLARVAALEIPDGGKWRLVELAAQFDSFGRQVQDILDEAVALFRQKKALLQPLWDAFVPPLEQRLRAGGAAGLLKELGLRYSAAEEISLRFSAMAFNRVQMFAPGDCPAAARRSEVHYGILADWLNSRKSSAASDNARLLSVLRALDDKSRLSILCALRRQQLSTQQVVALVGLSPATVSHHMSELLGAGLVEMEKQGTAVNYRLRAQGVQELMDALRHRLC